MRVVAKRTIISDPAIFALMNGRKMFGWGARYGGRWVNEDFINENVCCVGFNADEHPEIFNVMLSACTGDIIYMKALGTTSESLCVMGVGYVTNGKLYQSDDDEDLGIGRRVNWIFTGETYLPVNMQKDSLWHSRLGTIYQEHSPIIQRAILDIFLNPANY